MKTLSSIRFPSIFRTMLVLAVLIIPPVAQAQWHAAVGAQNHDMGRQALAFLPNEMWIHAGDSITWKLETDEPHTVTFLKPGQVRPPFQVGCPPTTSPSGSPFDNSACVNAGTLAKGQNYAVTFPKPGNYKLVCLFHANMTAVVHVLPLSEALPHNQDFYDDEAADHRKDLLSDTDHDRDRDHERHDSEHHHHLRGAVTAGVGEVSATTGGSDSLSVLRFLEPTTVIHAGETVEWSNLDPVTPHTITFGVEPANPMPPSSNVKPDDEGALHATINSTADSVHSGFIVAGPQDRIGLAQAPLSFTRFRVTFTHAGVYPYICALHDTLGMKGKVIVLK